MNQSQDVSLIGVCGINCGSCPMYLVKDDPALAESLKQRINWNGVPCPGCRASKGKHQFTENTCATFACSSAKGVTFCYECKDFPCAKLNPAADRADVLPHNLKVFNLMFIKNHGAAKFLEKEPEFKARYFRGKMVIGKGPQME